MLALDKTRSAVVSLTSLLLGATASAQAQFLETGKLQWPTGGEAARRVVAGDLDGDGDVDVITGSQPVRPYRNIGGGAFEPLSVLTSLYEGGLVLFDADGDRDLDLVIFSDRVFAALWRNDGSGAFQPASGSLPAVPAYSIAAGDVDGDGDQDLVAGRWFGAAMLWVNDGSGRFTDVTAMRMPLLDRRTQSVAFADIDRDGDLDVFLGNVGYYSWPYLPNPGYSVLCVNDGSGRFSDATAQLYAYGAESAQHVAFTDVDRDGDPDLLVADVRLRLHRNDGSGRLVAFEIIDTGLSAPSRFGVADVDGDGDQDIVPPEGRRLVNDGSGRFTLGLQLAEQSSWGKDVVAVDVDGDRDADLLVAGERRSRLLLNDGLGNLADATARPIPITQLAEGVFGDFDGDGDADIAATRSPGSDSGIWLNDGRGMFAPSRRSVPYLDGYPVLARDFDGDADLDVFVVLGGTTPRLYLNDGSAGFTDATAGRVPSLRISFVVAGDLDGDGDVDLVTSQTDYGPLTILSNDGRGAFTARTLAAVPSYAMGLVDVDRDGDLDLIAGEYGRALRQFRNDGRGSFLAAPAATMPTTTVWATDIAAGDVDGDGDQDLVIARGLLLYLNDGQGAFADGTGGRIPSGAGSPFEVALGDIDDDGDLDLAGAQVYETETGFYRGFLLVNDGSGVFAAAWSRVAAVRFTSFGARMADVDGDGDLDLYDATLLLTNLHRHCHAPWLARIGHGYRIDLYSQPGYGNGVHFALPALADAPGSLALPPFGRLGLDPFRMLKLPVVAIGGSGVGSLTLAVPNDQALIGLSLYSQALMVTTPDLARARFTNVAHDVVAR